MLIKIGTYTLPSEFMAFTNVGENNKRYVNIIGVIKGGSRDDLQKRLDSLQTQFNADSATVYIGKDTRGIECVKSSPDAISMDFFDASPMACVNIQYRAEDKSQFNEESSVYTITGSSTIYIEGNEDTYPTMTVHFTGGSSTIHILNSLTSQTFEYVHDFVAGDELVINSAEQTVEVNDIPVIEDAEDLEYVKLAQGKNIITLTTDNDAGLLIEYNERHA